MNINTKSDHQRENALIFKQILATHFLRKCMEISLKLAHVILPKWLGMT